MIKKFLLERLSWIALFVFLQLFLLFVAFIDNAIPFTPILYFVFLSLIVFTFFLFIRYTKETRFYRSIIEREDNLDLTGLAEPDSPFEHLVETSITNQTEQLKKVALLNQTALEQEKDELLSWIHEVKTPLTAMHLMIDRLQDEKLKTHLTYEWLRIHFLLDQQLHQKRIPFIENDLYIEKIELESVIFTEIKTLQSWCIQKGIGFDIQLEENEVLSDIKWLAFIIRQLLTNAVKYSKTSDIIVSSKRKDNHTVLTIKDFGRGIGLKDLPRIFDRGFTSTTQHQDNAATGMGLYLAKKAAKTLLIRIDVSSELEKGTIFTLTFPKQNEFVNIKGM